MSAERGYTLDHDALIAEAEKLPWNLCVAFRVETDGSHHFCADCGRSINLHIIQALLSKRSRGHDAAVAPSEMPEIRVGDLLLAQYFGGEHEPCEAGIVREVESEAVVVEFDSAIRRVPTNKIWAIYRDPLWRKSEAPQS